MTYQEEISEVVIEINRESLAARHRFAEARMYRLFLANLTAVLVTVLMAYGQ